MIHTKLIRPRKYALHYKESAEPVGYIFEDTMKRTAILVDGGFYRPRMYSLTGDKQPEERAAELEEYCLCHINTAIEERELYRVFYYDCMPSRKRIYHPKNKVQVDLGQSPLYRWMCQFIEELKNKRKFALRLGELSEEQLGYKLKTDALKKLYNGKVTLEELGDDDFELNIQQKGVDMKIGIDIASLAYKKQVDQIILISGDSDFVPAAKLARREGIDFVLDPMLADIKDNLREHIDGIETFVER